ncbi:MAG: hypothetical protein ACR2PL_22660 [Dehalococcoidia bacterium]
MGNSDRMVGNLGRVLKQLGAIGAAVSLLFLLVGHGSTSVALAQGAHTVTLTFGPGRDATQAGTVILTQAGATQTTVTLSMQPGDAGLPQPAHIHEGGCPGVGAIKYPLSNVVAGMSTTTVDVPLQALFDGGYSVNVHRSMAEAAIYTACVNIPACAGSHVGPARCAGLGTGMAAAPPATAASAAVPAAAMSMTAAPAAAQRPTGPSLPNSGVGPGPLRDASRPSAFARVTPSAGTLDTAFTFSAAGLTPNNTVELVLYDGAGQSFVYQVDSDNLAFVVDSDGTVALSVVPSVDMDGAMPGAWEAVIVDQETGASVTIDFDVAA